MVAQHVDHMRELKTTTLEKIRIAIATSTFHEIVRVWFANVSGNKNIAAENQHISTVCVLNVQITKFKM
jgi:hypothetical protein